MRFAAGGAPPGIYKITENVADLASLNWNRQGFADTTGRTGASSAITGGEKTAVIIIPGQSNVANSRPSDYTVTQAKSHALNIYDGAVYVAKDPQLGADSTDGSFAGILADKLIVAGTFTRVILVPIAMDGSQVQDWTPRGPYFQRLRVAYLRCRANGWVGNADVHMLVLLGIGETDNVLNTTQANWQAYFQEMKAGLDGYGFTGKYWVNKQSMSSNAVDATIQAAQAAVVDNVRVFACADVDSLTGGTNREADGTHLSDTGMTNMAELCKVALAAHY